MKSELITPREAQAFILALARTLPCSECRGHAEEYVKKNPFPDGPTVGRWLCDFHNAVSARNNKPTHRYEDVRLFYQTFCASTSTTTCNGTCSGSSDDKVEKFLQYRRLGDPMQQDVCFSGGGDPNPWWAWLVFGIGLACLIASIIFFIMTPQQSKSNIYEQKRVAPRRGRSSFHRSVWR